MTSPGRQPTPLSAEACSQLRAPTHWLRWLPWPLPALFAWALAWSCFVLTAAPMNGTTLRFVVATLTGAACAVMVRAPWRRALVVSGFPLSALLLGAAPNLPAWLWLVAMVLLVALYPLRAWSDAPFFPTRRQALLGLDKHVHLSPQALVLDAGCGLGHGLQALRGVWPQARFQGTEWSLGLAVLTRLRCPWATVQRGDMWAQSWAPFDLVYVFQRPESMARAMAKARAEMPAGAWLVSLEFAVPSTSPGAAPTAHMQVVGQREVWAYCIDPLRDARVCSNSNASFGDKLGDELGDRAASARRSHRKQASIT